MGDRDLPVSSTKIISAECWKAAQELIDEFCDTDTESQAAPSDQELERFWLRCYLLYASMLEPAPIAHAISGRLVPNGPGHCDDVEGSTWQPHGRACHVLKFLQGKGAV